MKTSRRFRLTLLGAMIGIAAIAGGLAWGISERKSRRAAIASALPRQEARVEWAEKMSRLGYVTPQQAKSDREKLDQMQRRMSEWWPSKEGRD